MTGSLSVAGEGGRGAAVRSRGPAGVKHPLSPTPLPHGEKGSPCRCNGQVRYSNGTRGSNLARRTLKKAFTLRTFASLVNSRCASAW